MSMNESTKEKLNHAFETGNDAMIHHWSEVGGKETMLEIRANCMPQVDALTAAGWLWEIPLYEHSEPWPWAWRRPSRRVGSKGMRFASTQQAYNHLVRNSPENSITGE